MRVENFVEYKKCNEDGFCRWLLERCQTEQTFKGKKIATKGIVKYDYFVFYTKGSDDSGMALNFCPFCSFSFYDLYNKGKRVGGGSLAFEVNGTRKV